MYMQKCATSFKDLGLKWSKDESCMSCPQGICETKGTARQKYQGVNFEWFIHITVINKECNDTCNYVYKASFVPSNQNEHMKAYDEKFKSEEECVTYLCSTFYEVYCVNKS